MQGILLLYLYRSIGEGGLAIDPGVAAGLVGAYGGGVYLSTIIGGWLADRVLGSERVLFYSAVIIMLGHIALAVVPGIAGVAIGLILVALGSGGLTASATAVVGSLYAPDDPRDAGFSLFYLGINLGAFLGPILTGLLQENAGFHWGFGLAAVGMAAGLIQYTLGRKNLPPHASQVPDPLPRERYPLMIGIAAGTVVLVVIGVLTGLINPGNLALLIIVAVVAAAVSYFVVIISSRHVTDHRQPATPLHHDHGPGLPAVRGGRPELDPTAGADRHCAGVHPRRTAAFPGRALGDHQACAGGVHTQMVALFYLSVSLGTAISGELARFYTGENEGTYFGALGGIAIGIGALLAVASPWVLKLMRGVR